MSSRSVRQNRFSAAVCATVIAAVSAWAFVNSTASIERDPFRFASIMEANAKMQVVQVIGSHGSYLSEGLREYGQPGLWVPPPACLKGCA
jgi:hypothetical protein